MIAIVREEVGGGGVVVCALVVDVGVLHVYVRGRITRCQDYIGLELRFGISVVVVVWVLWAATCTSICRSRAHRAKEPHNARFAAPQAHTPPPQSPAGPV